MRNIDLFEDYISGKLTPEETKNFEKRLGSDSEFNAEFHSHKKLMCDLKEAAETIEMKKSMDVWHLEEFEDSTHLNTRNEKLIYLRTAAIAASVSLVFLLGGLLLYRYSFEKKNNNPYQELVNRTAQEIQDVKRGIEKLNKKEVAPANMEASGFFISSKGYFITSLHSVKNADSVMVQNEKLDYVTAEKVVEDSKLDVAIFKLNLTEDNFINELPICFRDASIDLGEKVFSVGYPRETIVYSEGNISAESGLNGDTTKFQLSMLINPGSSGSPVMDETGSIVGIISGRNTNAQGVSYAVKSKYIQELLANIEDENLKNELIPNNKNNIKKLKRTEQLKKIKPYILSIKVYKSN